MLTNKIDYQQPNFIVYLNFKTNQLYVYYQSIKKLLLELIPDGHVLATHRSPHDDYTKTTHLQIPV